SVEPDVDAVVEFQILWARQSGNEGHTIGLDAFQFQQVQGVLAMGAFGGQEHEPGAIDSLEDLGPKLQDRNVHFAEVVEAAERDVAVFQGRQRVDRRFAGKRIVAPESVWKADRFLRVVVVVEARRIDVGVGKAVVDGRKASGAWIGKPAYLHGRGLAGENQDTIPGHVHAQVHENVDLVLADQL